MEPTQNSIPEGFQAQPLENGDKSTVVIIHHDIQDSKFSMAFQDKSGIVMVFPNGQDNNDQELLGEGDQGNNGQQDQ